ncbi:MAG TPA: selenocysteine-specific translation elongation factor [Terriglobales bacterium]
MKSVIVGTAGHIDHGKTALVKALTGIDADRLQEEKRRGITIDLGFAHLDLPAPDGDLLRLGFVDVPGHERFVRNMLAGIGGIDIVLFVIAADESIKPQTREHFDICRLLSVRHGITVLTKADTVDADTLQVVRLEVEDFLRGSFLDPAITPIIPVSSLRGTGIEALKQALQKMATRIDARDSTSIARLPVDRVFSMKGFGTVLTGTLVSGTIAKEAELEVFPGSQRVRVRGVQVHGSSTSQAVAGQRTALNLASVATAEITRGMTLTPPSLFRSTSSIDVKLSLLTSTRPLKDRSRVHFHAYTSESIATVSLLDKAVLEPGGSAYANLRLGAPGLFLPGDRFIVRQFSPVITIGGGVVLDAAPLNRKLRKQDRLSFLHGVGNGSGQEQILLTRIERRGRSGLSLRSAVSETGWTTEKVHALAQALVAGKQVVRAEEFLVSAASFQAAARELHLAIRTFQESNPLVAGISKEQLRDRLDLPVEVFAAVLGRAVESAEIEITGDQVHLAGHGVKMKDDEAASKKIIETAFASAGLQVPLLKDVLAGLTIDRARAHKIMTLLLREKILVKITDELVFHRDSLAKLRQGLLAEKAKSSKMDVGRFKDFAGITRKYAIPLLEYLDREHVTRRVGNERIIL